MVDKNLIQEDVSISVKNQMSHNKKNMNGDQNNALPGFSK